MTKLDTLDLKILTEVQENCRIPIADLSEICAASTASIQRRLKRLRKLKVIKREVAVIDRPKAGFTIKAIISVELERDSAVETINFKRKATEEHCYCVAGEADFTLIVVAQNMSDYENFTHRFFFANSNVRKFKTAMVVSEQKATHALPLL